MLAEAERLYGRLPKTAVVPNGRAAGGSADKEPFVFAAGRMWDEAKNLAGLASVRCAWPVHVAGDGSPMGRLPHAEVMDWMSRAAIYALPARYEPFGLSILEAALAGCALVLGDIPSLRENWDGCALFVQPDDPDAHRSAIALLTQNADLRAELARKARARGEEFDLARFADGYRRLYDEMAGRYPPSFSSAGTTAWKAEPLRNQEGPGVEPQESLR